MKKVLITGSSGLVGKATIEKLLESADCEIYAASSQRLENLGERLHFIKNESIKETLSNKKIDVLLQLAFPRNVQENQWAGGLEFVVHVFGLAKKYGVGRVINVSSQSIYGWQRKTSAKEGDQVFLNSPYTTGKYFSELMVNELFDDIPHTNVRLSTTISPTTDERVPNKFFAQIVGGNDLRIKGGNQIFSFLDVRDAAKGLRELVMSNVSFREIYNLGTSECATLLEIANMAIDIGRKYGYKVGMNIEQANINLNNMIDVSAMEQDFGWKAEITLRESLEYMFYKNYVSNK